MFILCLLVLSIVSICVNGFYTINYYSNSADFKLSNIGGSFSQSPTADQVADLCLRLFGHPPILNEGELF